MATRYEVQGTMIRVFSNDVDSGTLYTASFGTRGGRTVHLWDYVTRKPFCGLNKGGEPTSYALRMPNCRKCCAHPNAAEVLAVLQAHWLDKARSVASAAASRTKRARRAPGHVEVLQRALQLACAELAAINGTTFGMEENRLRAQAVNTLKR